MVGQVRTGRRDPARLWHRYPRLPRHAGPPSRNPARKPQPTPRHRAGSRNEEKVMDYHGLIKRLNLPAGWTAPTELTYDDIRAVAISREHLEDDVRGINASIDLI